MAAAPVTEPLIEAHDLTRSYRQSPAVQGVSFTIAVGEVFGLLGPDGAGKSTLMQILAGVLLPTSGRAQVAGYDVAAEPEAVKTRIGYMPQGLGLNLYDTLSVAENIDFFGDLREVPAEVFQENKTELLRITRLEPFLDRPAGQLSGGMRQKLALCCTLIHLPQIIFLDEPTTGVDPISRRDFWLIINRLVVERGATVFMTTSYMDEAERCHRVALLHKGRIIAQGPTATLQAEAGCDAQGRPCTLEEVFIRAMARESVAAAPEPATTCALPKPEPVIRVENLTKKFGAFVAVDQVSFEVYKGEIFGFLGPNGAGKTTVIKILTGILAPTSGRGCVAGLQIGRDGSHIKVHLGYMSQKFSLYRDLSVAENIRLYGRVYGMARPDLNARLPEILSLADLEGQGDRLAGDLPLGVRQRLALGCAILHRPDIVFLDEPTSGVDPLARRKFWHLICSLAAQGVTIMVSTHYMDEAQNCQRLAFIHHGRLAAVGAPEELRLQAQEAIGQHLEISSPEFGQVFLTLRPHFPQAFLHGSRIHLSTREPEQDSDKVRQFIRRAGLPLEHLVTSPLTMEDTFIYFIQGQEHAV
ncbi:MAG: ABC transporter ATP-binding protein [Deltaproteobacteria bacterium]|nr:ABC transporter ATP-binding protein [Deltaproteobacteria bacterium]